MYVAQGADRGVVLQTYRNVIGWTGSVKHSPSCCIDEKCTQALVQQTGGVSAVPTGRPQRLPEGRKYTPLDHFKNQEQSRRRKPSFSVVARTMDAKYFFASLMGVGRNTPGSCFGAPS